MRDKLSVHIVPMVASIVSWYQIRNHCGLILEDTPSSIIIWSGRDIWLLWPISQHEIMQYLYVF